MWPIAIAFTVLVGIVIGLSVGMTLSYGGDKSAPAFVVSNLIDLGLTPGEAVVTDSSNQLASLAYSKNAIANTIVQRDGAGVGTFTCVKYAGTFPATSCVASGIVLSSQIFTLHSIPLTVVPAPGAGIFTFPRRVLFEYVAGGVGFSANPTFSMIWPVYNTSIFGAGALNINNGTANFITIHISQSIPTAFLLNASIRLQSSADVVNGTGTVYYVFEYDLISNLS